LFRKSKVEDELDDELRFHLENLTGEHIAQGISPEDARFTALRELGGVEQHKEECRDVRGLRWLEDLIQDLRYGIRILRRNPGFTAVAVITIALGIGANAAIFSFVDAALLKQLPYREPDRLVRVYDSGGSPVFCSRRELASWRTEATAFSDLVMQEFGSSTNLSGPTLEYPQPLLASRVSANYFEFLGIHTALGRGFLPEDSTPGGNAVVVLSNRIWRGSLGADPEIFGKAIYLNGKKHLVIGVLPSGIFDRMLTDVWRPLPSAPETTSFGYLMGRLKPGATTAQAAAQMTRLFALQHPKKKEAASVVALGAAVVPRDTRTILLLLFGAVAFILLIACGNLANLLLGRAAARHREIAIRLSLGAGRFRLVRQFLSESLLLSIAGGSLGTMLAVWLVRILSANAPAKFMPAEAEVAVDVRVLLFAFGLSLATGVMFGLAPALQHSSTRRVQGIDAHRANLSLTSGRKTHRVQRAVLLSEVALSLMLVAGAALMVNSLLRMYTVDLGFDAAGLLTGRISLSEKVFPTPADKRIGLDELTARLRVLPGVRSVALGHAAPFSEALFDAPLFIDGQQRMCAGAMIWMVTPEYFDTLGMRLQRGRWLSAIDGQGAPGALVVDRAFARSCFGDVEPIGQTITSPVLGDPQWRIVGVVDSVVWGMHGSMPNRGVFVPLAQLPPKTFSNSIKAVSFVARVDGDPLTLVPAIQSIAASLDKSQPVRNLDTMQGTIDKRELQEPRFRTMILAAFGGLALVLAVVGIYGVFHYWVLRRTQEIGIRLALGAQGRDVITMILGQGLRLVLPGIVVGLAGAAALAALLRSMLFEVKPYDPSTLVIAVLLEFGAAMLACYIPARRAGRIDPMEALRLE
jgi:putative ABC transport system permease protein